MDHPSPNGLQSIPLAEVTRVRTEPLVGGGRLEIERRSAPTAEIAYTQSMGEKFSEVARGLEQLRAGEPFLINPRWNASGARSARGCCPSGTGSVPPASASGPP